MDIPLSRDPHEVRALIMDAMDRSIRLRQSARELLQDEDMELHLMLLHQAENEDCLAAALRAVRYG